MSRCGQEQSQVNGSKKGATRKSQPLLVEEKVANTLYKKSYKLTGKKKKTLNFIPVENLYNIQKGCVIFHKTILIFSMKIAKIQLFAVKSYFSLKRYIFCKKCNSYSKNYRFFYSIHLRYFTNISNLNTKSLYEMCTAH